MSEHKVGELKGARNMEYIYCSCGAKWIAHLVPYKWDAVERRKFIKEHADHFYEKVGFGTTVLYT